MLFLTVPVCVALSFTLNLPYSQKVHAYKKANTTY